LVIITYITQQLNQLHRSRDLSPHPAADAASVAGVAIHAAVEGVDYTRAVSTVALSVDVVSAVPLRFCRSF